MRGMLPADSLNDEPRPQMHLLLLSELIAALRVNDPDTFKQWLERVAQNLGEHAVAELMLEWMVPLLTQDEADRLVG